MTDWRGRLAVCSGHLLVGVHMNDPWELISPDKAWLALFERSPQALLVIAPESRRVITANKAAEEIYGFDRGTMVGSPVEDLVDPADQAAASRLVSRSTSSAFASAGRHRRVNGGTFHAHVHVVEIDAIAGALLLVTVLDKSEPDLIDAASGLPDPRLFIDRLEQSIAHAHRGGGGLGVCLLRINRLDQMLDDLSADGSQRLLHDIGDRLRANLRESDTVARVGSSEFALILEGVGEREAVTQVLRKVLEDFEFEFRVGDEDIPLEAVVGVSIYPHDGHEADMLVENAAFAARAAANARTEGVRFFGDA
jgi:diguanylate cyclase (GGDEF)-like protein/PAS domain S-box-containing protein